MGSTAVAVICARCDQRILGSGHEATVGRALSADWEVISRGDNNKKDHDRASTIRR
jgi:hypothetical protein